MLKRIARLRGRRALIYGILGAFILMIPLCFGMWSW